MRRAMHKKANEEVTSCNMNTSRRGFLKASAATAGTGVTLCASRAGVVQASGQNASKELPITMAGYNNGRVRALIDGRVKVAGCDARFEVASIGDMNTHVFSGPRTREVSEIGLSPFMLAYANEGFRAYTLIPVFPLRMFRHKSIFVRTGSSVKRPEDLKGRKVATAGYSSTSLTWLRGIIQHEHGVSPKDIQWVISTKDSSAEASGKISKQEQVLPEGISFTSGPAGMDESDLLVNGEVDALFHAAQPKAFVKGDPRIQRLFPDSRSVEQAYFKKTGVFPIMHAVAMSKDAIKANPWLPKAVFEAYSLSKKADFEYMKKLGWALETLPWFGQEFEETVAVMGEYYWPYGIEPNRKALEALFQYSHEQGLAAKKLTIEELFHPSTLQLVES